MSRAATVPVRQGGDASRERAPDPALGRRCACGRHTVGGGECAACRVQRLGAGRRARSGSSRTGLQVAAADDGLEHEADRAATEVMDPSRAGPVRVAPRSAPTRGLPGLGVESVPGGSGRPLAPGTRAFLEPRLGTDLEEVRVHTGRAARAGAAALGARAFTYGREIWLGPGESDRDLALMAHEAVHVVQQRAQPRASRKVQRAVDPDRVSCADRPEGSPIFTAMRTNDPAGVLAAADRRAIQLLDSVIDTLEHGRNRVQSGAPAAWPTISDTVAVALRDRLRLDPSDPDVWTGSGAGSVEIIVRWFGNIRGLLESGRLRYICISPGCDPGDWAFTFAGERTVRLCRPFWGGSDDDQALTLIHEVAHLYYGLEDSGGGPGNVHCLEQFVADLHGIPIQPEFAGSCRLSPAAGP